MLVVLTTTGLGLLTWGLLLMHGMTYGAGEVLRPQAGAPAPEVDDYARAFLVAMTVNVAVGLVVVWLAEGTRARRRHPVTVGVVAALVAAVSAASTLLLMLGISPLGFLTAL